MLIFKLFRKDEWLKFKASGRTDGAPIDVSDGFGIVFRAIKLNHQALAVDCTFIKNPTL